MEEAILRDIIAQKISKLKPGLVLLQKEQYIPGDECTKSFIDLYAKDEKGRHVLIELKRSVTASRQAIHEVIKYVERVKKYFGAKDSEIHVIIASTEWKELLLPFSRFYVDAGFSVEGIQIEMLANNEDFEVKTITPVPITQGRFIAPWHNVYWYKDRNALEHGIIEIENAYQSKGIEDYLIVKLYLEDNSTAEERQNKFKENVATAVGVSTSELSEYNSNFEIPKYEYIAYSAVQMLSREQCMHIVSYDKELFEEINEHLPGMGNEEALCYLHECIECVKPSPKGDYYEIGYPDKFEEFFESCTNMGVVRHGIFKRNPLLTDDIIYSEIRGEDGATGQKYKNKVDMQNNSDVFRLKEEITEILKINPIWKNHIIRIVDEISIECPNSEIDIYVYNPSTGIFTIYYSLTKENGELFLPNYYIIVKNPNVTRMYFGALETNGNALSFSDILNKYYYGDITALLLSVTWGGKDDRDSCIIEDLGMQYRSYRADISNDVATTFHTLRDEKWRASEMTNTVKLFNTYVKINESLVKQIISEIGSHDKGAFFN